ncbi:MAG: DMT family transporter [Rhodospirillaceae bacterium]|nr:DMT family transporter [Rhodospirillaceae bacterium]MBL6940879.1 DMT family transporter [Rhodospirillales bacterium]
MVGNGSRTGRNLFAGTTEDNQPLAAALLVGSLFLLGLQDALIKVTSSDVSLWQFQFFRAFFNLLLLLIFLRGLPAVPKRIWAVALRSFLLCGAMVCFFSGVPFLSLADIAAGLYVFPLIIAALSGLVLGEKVGPRRVIAILIGFSGTLLILKPGTDSFTLVSLMPVFAAMFYACTILTTRKLCREESPVTLAFGVAFAFLILGSLGLLFFSNQPFGALAQAWPYLFTGWHSIDLGVYGIIAICSALNVSANISLAKAYQTAESSWLAPFDYSYLVFATFWGIVIWGDVPDVLMLIGMFLIAGSGGFVAWRERQESKALITR